MPAELLFDIDHLDLNATVLTREGLRKYIDQRDVVEQLDRIIWVNEDRSRAAGLRRVRDDEWWVPGHIPGKPILPGVLMVETAAQFSTFLYRYKLEYQGKANPNFLGFAGIDNTRFRATVSPGDDLLFIVREKRFGSRRIVADVQAVTGAFDGRTSDYQIAFETRIIGMPLDGVKDRPGEAPDPPPAAARA